jgi:transcriptional regulator of acetoin/glycerol metabolism
MAAHLDLAHQIHDDLRSSWERSRLSGVDPETLPVPYELDLVEPDSRLWRAARPVLEHFGQLLDGTPTCLALADSQARGIATWVGDPGLNPKLDALGARPGFRFAEEIAGTNGVGTPLETGRPIYIAPGQHFAAPLNPLTCAGAPVRHPLTRRLQAVINLTSAAEDHSNLLLPYVMEMARQVESRLYDEGSGQEQLLLRHFLAASRGSARAVVVVSPEVMLANPAATRLLENVPQALVWEFAAKSVADSTTTVDELLGEEDHPVTVRCLPINEAGVVIGATLEFGRRRRVALRRSADARHPAPALPGLAGRSLAWRRVCRRALALAELSGTPGAVVAGEPGTGKRSVALALLAAGGAAPAAVFDAAVCASRPGWRERLRAQLAAPDRGPILLTHLDCLSYAAVRAVCAMVDERAGSAPPVVATLTVGERPVFHCAPLLDRIGQARIDVPPLRQRPEDIVELVSALLGRLSPRRPQHRMTPEAVQVLTRFAWPGNVRQLEATLRSTLACCPGAEIRPGDLPADIRRGASGRRLTTMEQAELDAIVAVLDETGGNKVEAAARLGISRSTLYRKLRSFGLELDQVVF